MTGPQQSVPPTAPVGDGRTREPRPAWNMPGGEDLLNFALSAGLAAGAWWLEMLQEPAGAAASEPGSPPGSERRPR